MEQLRWYLEHFLDYPFDREIGHAERVLDALQAWGTQAFNALFDRRDAGDWLAGSEILPIRSEDPHLPSSPLNTITSRMSAASSAASTPSPTLHLCARSPRTASTSCWWSRAPTKATSATAPSPGLLDRKSTRLNSSHLGISY